MSMLRTARRVSANLARASVLAAAVVVASAPLLRVAHAQDADRNPASIIVAPRQSSLVFARDGSLIGELGPEWRTSVPIASLPAFLPQAFVAVEDQRFYRHNGVDLVGVAGAVKDNILGASRGASTITQQLVGNMHPTIIDRSDPSIGRKLREQQAARELEKHYTKEQILEAYLNQILFGHGWYGVEAAARHYFGKSASEVSLPEAAMLAALPKGPAIYDPIRHPARARQRRDVVLTLMVEQKFITAAQAAAAKRTPVRTAPNAGFSVHAPYFVDAVRGQLERAGLDLAKGGYRIHTTADPRLQQIAADALVAGLDSVEARPGYSLPTFARRRQGNSDYLQGAFVALAPESGDVLALVGGRNYAAAPFNRAVSAYRQPGSAFKPFVYATAIRDSLPPNARVVDSAIIVAYDQTVYQPRNADGEFLGGMTLRNALVLSRNPVAVQLWEEAGADSVIAMARRMGISTAIAPFPSSAVGASTVQPLNLAAAYATIANLGDAVEPRLLSRVDDAAGRTVWSAGIARHEAVADSLATFIVRDMMRDAVDRGTAAAVRRYLPSDIPVAGKTGTTDDVTDVWFVGMTPDIVAAVWLGFDRPRTIAEGAAGGTLAAPIFGDAIARWYRGRGVGSWPVPLGLITAELDRTSGELATDQTPPAQRYTEYFLPGTEPSGLRLDVRRLFSWGPILF